ncbi:neuroendocrine convertase 1-like [Planococcus citri]|uniref:neuroendocrine convertase 1-like n=1 Tax=Planococcus citri TaxID=170843 RepID=UPI0031F926FB
MKCYVVFVIFSIFITVSLSYFMEGEDGDTEYSKIIPGAWILHIPAGFEVAKKIADAEGFQNMYEIPRLKLFHMYDLKPSEETEEHISIRLSKYTEEITYATPSRREKVAPFEYTDRYYCAGPKNDHYITNRPHFYSDPLYHMQWYLRSCSDLEGSERSSNYDMKIVQAWDEFKVTGNGIVVLVIDNGVFIDHKELRNRISLKYSKNYTTKPKTNNPTPENFKEDHGTKCAGIIAMEANNGVCGVGIAPKATIGGQKYVVGHSYDVPDVAEALTYEAEEVHIVSMSMGEFESKAFIWQRPEPTTALDYGIQNGRGGKGIIYVFPSGNGKREGETCSSDGSLQMIHKIVVGGAKHNGSASDYAEGCASVMVVSHSGNGNPYAHIVPDMGSDDACDDNFNGTSAGCPVVAAIIALLLEANPNLTWRDVKYAIAWTSEIAPLAKNRGWVKNAAGFHVNFDFGFGLINAYELILLGKNFPGTTPALNMCVEEHTLRDDEKTISGMQSTGIRFVVNGCRDTPQEIKFLEFVEVTVSIQHPARGFLQIMLTSPGKTVTQLLPPRKQDRSDIEIKNFSFLSVHNWGEQPEGEWLIELIDTSGRLEGTLGDVVMTFYGTKEQPELYKRGPRKYAEFSFK